jgi:GTP-binding protein
LHAERVLVSDIPGTTRDSIDVPFSVEGRRYTLIDTAGSRREARVDTAVERYSRYRMQESIERADIVVLMIDVERGVGLLDKQLASEIVEQGKGCVVVVNKWDLSTVKEKEYSQTLWQGLPFMSYCPVVFMSAKSGFNVNSVIGAIDYVASQSMATLPTGLLNRVMEEAYNRTPPPSKDGKRMRMYYCVQVGKNPIGIRVFVNDPKRVPASYKSYLINSLREKFGLEGVIVYIQFRARSGGKTADGAESAKKAEKKGAAKKPANRKPVPAGETSMSAMKKRRLRRQQAGYKVK